MCFEWQVSVVDELGIPVKFVGVGEGIDDLQPFDAEAFVNAIFPWFSFETAHKICLKEGEARERERERMIVDYDSTLAIL